MSSPVGAGFRSNDGKWDVDLKPQTDATIQVSVCVPANGYADVAIDPRGAGPVWGDLATKNGIGLTRQRGIWLNRIALADEIGKCATAT